MSSYSEAVLSDNPLLYLRLDETSGSSCANSGSLGGIATCNGTFVRNIAAAHANLGVAVDLAGTVSDFISYPDNAALDITGDVTYEAWANLDTFTGNQYLMSKGRDASNAGGYGLMILTDRTIQVREGGFLLLSTSAGVLPSSGWHHIAFTRIGNLYTIYLDGVSVGSGTNTQGVFASAKNMEIGRNSYEGGTQFPVDGKVDEIAVYNTGLSAARIAAHYVVYNVPSGTASKIKFGSGLGVTDEGSGIVRVDASAASKKLFDQTLAVDALSIDTGAGGIPSGYGVLDVFIYGRTDEVNQGTECHVRLNGDAGANYDWQRISASATAVAASSTVDNGWDGFVAGGSAVANVFGMIHLVIPAYDNTVGFKTGRWTDGFADVSGASGRIAAKSGTWRNTGAITRLSVQAAFSGTVKLKAGSRMMIYGRG